MRALGRLAHRCTRIDRLLGRPILIQIHIEHAEVGGADRDRTGDPSLAKRMLSQLSYSPILERNMVGLGRFELPTSPLSGVRSNQLSYRPERPGFHDRSILLSGRPEHQARLLE